MFQIINHPWVMCSNETLWIRSINEVLMSRGRVSMNNASDRWGELDIKDDLNERESQ
jgi:hypothetical protein